MPSTLGSSGPLFGVATRSCQLRVSCARAPGRQSGEVAVDDAGGGVSGQHPAVEQLVGRGEVSDLVPRRLDELLLLGSHDGRSDAGDDAVLGLGVRLGQPTGVGHGMDVEVPLAVQRRTERAGLPRLVHPGPEHLADPRVLLRLRRGWWLWRVCRVRGCGRRCHQRAADRYHRSGGVRVEVVQLRVAAAEVDRDLAEVRCRRDGGQRGGQ